MTNVYLKFKFIIISLVNKFNNWFNDLISNDLKSSLSVHNPVHKLPSICE